MLKQISLYELIVLPGTQSASFGEGKYWVRLKLYTQGRKVQMRIQTSISQPATAGFFLRKSQRSAIDLINRHKSDANHICDGL